MRGSQLSRIIGSIGLLLVLGYSGLAEANTFIVNSLADPSASGLCTLHDAIIASNTGLPQNGCNAGSGIDTINFSVSGTILLAATLPEIEKTLTINGPTKGIAISGQNAVQVMTIGGTASVTLNGLAIINGLQPFGGSDGGGIHCSGALSINNSLIYGNHSETESGGGGIFIGGSCVAVIDRSTIANNQITGGDTEGGAITDFGRLTITNSTIAYNVDNAIGSAAGGIGVDNQGSMTMVNCTLYGNQAGSGNQGSAFFINDGSTATITASTISGNIGDRAVVQFSASVTLRSTILSANGTNCRAFSSIGDAGYNISDDASCAFTASTSANSLNPKLSPYGLANNGGPTQTVALLPTSPAVDAIPYAACIDQASPNPNQITTDQRGYPRPAPVDGKYGSCDIGAYELQTSHPSKHY